MDRRPLARRLCGFFIQMRLSNRVNPRNRMSRLLAVKNSAFACRFYKKAQK
jgi:hypothetical protein